MKHRNKQCPLVPAVAKQDCPLKPALSRERSTEQPSLVVVRTERRSWFALAMTGFGALLLRYLKTVRERGLRLRHR